MNCSMCGAQNSPGAATCYNCGTALAQSFAQPQQQWAPQQSTPPAQQQWVPEPTPPVQQQWAPPQPAAPAQQQWAPPQPAMPAAPLNSGGYGGATSSWDQGFSYSGQGSGAGSNIVKIASITIVSLILVGGGTLTTLWATGVIWSEPEIVGEWTDANGDALEFKEDGTMYADEMEEDGAKIEWEVDEDYIKWTVTYSAFECDDGETIPLSFVNDDDWDCRDGEDEGVSQSFINSRTVDGDSTLMNLEFRIVGDVMFLRLASMMQDGESITMDDDECIAFVRRDVADRTSEWNDALDSTTIPSMCDGVDSYDGGDSGTARYSFNLEDDFQSVSGASDDSLVQITMSNGEDLSWSMVGIQISVEGSSMYTCANPDQNYDSYACRAYGGSGSTWDTGETIVIYESGGYNHCTSYCEIEVLITNQRDGEVLFTGYTYVD